MMVEERRSGLPADVYSAELGFASLIYIHTNALNWVKTQVTKNVTPL